MKNKKLWALSKLFLSISLAQAANVTNKITGVGPKSDPVNPYFCIQNTSGQVTAPLQYGQSTDANIASAMLTMLVAHYDSTDVTLAIHI